MSTPNPGPQGPPGPLNAQLPAIVTYPHQFSQPEPRTHEMAVFKELQGQHKERCLCFRCKKFKPEDRDENCPVANLLFAVCVQCDIVAPVAECHVDMFEERTEPHPWINR